MKNILFVHSSSELYGSDRSLLNIVKNIDKEKFHIHIILPCQGPLVNEINKVPNVKLGVHNIAVLRRKNLSIAGGIKFILEFINSYKYLKYYITQNDIDIVDTNTAVVFPAAIAAKRLRKKSIWHIREIIKNRTENRIISYIMNRYADIIIANSKATGKAICVDQEKVRVVYNAVDEKKNIEKKSHSQLTIGMAGRINRWKGQKLFVDAAEIIHNKFPDVVFEIAGDTFSGEEYLKDELIQYIKKKDLSQNVRLLGQVNNMNDFYSGLDIFVLPSIQPEPFGLVIIEAMGFGIPVIATNHGGPTEIITDGVEGYLVDYKSANQMAERLIELLSDEKKRFKMGQNGIKRKRKSFSIVSMVNSLEEIFNEC
mgnify:CR=1 FL=1